MDEKDIEMMRETLLKIVADGLDPVTATGASYGKGGSHKWYEATKKNLNLGDGAGSRRFDVLHFPFVLMGLVDARVWIDNALKIARYVVVQDCIRAWRGNDSELSPPHDVTRFMTATEAARVPGAIDIGGYDVMCLETYPGSLGPEGRDTLKVIAVLRGTEPVKVKEPKPTARPAVITTLDIDHLK